MCCSTPDHCSITQARRHESVEERKTHPHFGPGTCPTPRASPDLTSQMDKMMFSLMPTCAHGHYENGLRRLLHTSEPSPLMIRFQQNCLDDVISHNLVRWKPRCCVFSLFDRILELLLIPHLALQLCTKVPPLGMLLPEVVPIKEGCQGMLRQLLQVSACLQIQSVPQLG